MRRPAGTYRLFGLTIRSALELPCRRIAPRRPDVTLDAGDAGRFAALAPPRGRRREEWFHCRRLPDGATWLRWSGLFEFLISPDGRAIHYRRLARAGDESFTTYLLGQVLSFSLLARGDEPLHGTVVAADGRALAFLGDCGDGKSTIGAAFLARGCPIVTDDVVALAERRAGYAVHPGVPRLKLYPRVSRRLLGVAGGPRLNDGTAKQVLPLKGRQAAGRQVPLAAIYILGRAGPGRRRIAIERLSRAEAMLAIVRNSFNTIVLGRERLARQFRHARLLVSSVPVRRLSYPRRLAVLSAVCDAVLKDAPG